MPALAYIRRLGLEVSLDISGSKDVVRNMLELSYVTPDYFYYKLPQNYQRDSSMLAATLRDIKDLIRISSASLIIAGVNDSQTFSMCARLGVQIVAIVIDNKNINRLIEFIEEAKKALQITFP